jgi:hypothetical protein
MSAVTGAAHDADVAARASDLVVQRPPIGNAFIAGGCVLRESRFVLSGWYRRCRIGRRRPGGLLRERSRRQSDGKKKTATIKNEHVFPRLENNHQRTNPEIAEASRDVAAASDPDSSVRKAD